LAHDARGARDLGSDLARSVPLLARAQDLERPERRRRGGGGCGAASGREAREERARALGKDEPTERDGHEEEPHRGKQQLGPERAVCVRRRGAIEEDLAEALPRDSARGGSDLREQGVVGALAAKLVAATSDEPGGADDRALAVVVELAHGDEVAARRGAVEDGLVASGSRLFERDLLRDAPRARDGR
jgi:hypothetical protein